MVDSDGVGGRSWTLWKAGTRSYETASRCLPVVSFSSHNYTLLRDYAPRDSSLHFCLIKSKMRSAMACPGSACHTSSWRSALERVTRLRDDSSSPWNSCRQPRGSARGLASKHIRPSRWLQLAARSRRGWRSTAWCLQTSTRYHPNRTVDRVEQQMEGETRGGAQNKGGGSRPHVALHRQGRCRWGARRRSEAVSHSLESRQRERHAYQSGGKVKNMVIPLVMGC